MASEAEASCESDPNFAIICAFMEKFGELCGIPSIDFVDLQQMLENNQEVSPELMNLHIKLLRKTKKNVTVERWERALVNMCHTFSSKDAWEIERFGYKKTRLPIKLRALKELLEMQFDFNTKFKNEVNKMTSEELRSQPLGRDKLGRAYWFQTDNNYQIRIYKEDPDDETWNLIAKDRNGLLSLITELSDGDSKLSSDSACNEDSNSLLEKPLIDTGQNDNSLESQVTEILVEQKTNEKITPNISSNFDLPNETLELTLKNKELNNSHTVSNEKFVISEQISAHKSALEVKQEEVVKSKQEEAAEIRRPMLRIKSLSELMERPKNPPPPQFLPDLPELTITKKPKLDLPEITILKKSNTRLQSMKSPQLSTVIESPLMIIRGNGSGTENKCSNVFIGKSVESSDLFNSSRYLTRDWKANNCSYKLLDNEEKSINEKACNDLFIGDEIEEPVMFIFGRGSGEECQTGNGEDVSNVHKESDKQESSNDCDLAIRDGSRETEIQIPTSQPTNIKLGTIIDSKTDSKSFVPRSLNKKSRWDQKETHGSEVEEKHESNFSPKKMTFFFGPGSLNAKPNATLNSSSSGVEIDISEKQDVVSDKIFDETADKVLEKKESEVVTEVNENKKPQMCEGVEENKCVDANINHNNDSGNSETTPSHTLMEQNANCGTDKVEGSTTYLESDHEENIGNDHPVIDVLDEKGKEPVKCDKSEVKTQGENICNESINEGNSTNECMKDDLQNEYSEDTSTSGEKNEIIEKEQQSKQTLINQNTHVKETPVQSAVILKSNEAEFMKEENKCISIEMKHTNLQQQYKENIHKIVESSGNKGNETKAEKISEKKSSKKINFGGSDKEITEEVTPNVSENIEGIVVSKDDVSSRVDSKIESSSLTLNKSDNSSKVEASENSINASVPKCDLEIVKTNKSKEAVKEPIDHNISQSLSVTHDLSDIQNEVQFDEKSEKGYEGEKPSNESDTVNCAVDSAIDAKLSENYKEGQGKEDEVVSKLSTAGQFSTTKLIDQKEIPIEGKTSTSEVISDSDLEKTVQKNDDVLLKKECETFKTETSYGADVKEKSREQEIVASSETKDCNKDVEIVEQVVENIDQSDQVKELNKNVEDIATSKKRRGRRVPSDAKKTITDNISEPSVLTAVRPVRQTRQTRSAMVEAPLSKSVKGRGKKKITPQTKKSDKTGSTDSPIPLESVTVNEVDSNSAAVDNTETDPLAVSDEDINRDQPMSTITSFSFDYDPSSPVSQIPVGRKNLRKRGRECLENKPEVGETLGKRAKTKGKRTVDLTLRKSVEEKRHQEVGDVSSDDNESVESPIKKKEPKMKKKGTTKKKSEALTLSDSNNSSQKLNTKKNISNTRNARILKNLGVKEEDLSAIADSPAPVRQSRRLAQIKIKEDAAIRRKIEEDDLTTIKKKKKKEDDKDFKGGKRKRIEEEVKLAPIPPMVEKKKRKKKKQDKIAIGWNTSSEDSENSGKEDEVSEYEYEEPHEEEPLQFKSDHEFSPESDLEGQGDELPHKRARTARKEESDGGETEEEFPCQKCGKSDHPEWILLCDKCDNGWHCSCLRPALFVIPEGDWFCPTCQHEKLLEKLNEKLVEFDKMLVKKEMEDRRKERLAYVGISLNNVLPAKDKKDKVFHESSGSSVNGSESETASESVDASDSDEPIYQLRQRRQAHSYKFQDYDDLINSALQEEPPVPVEKTHTLGRGKDIATIVNAAKEEEERNAEKNGFEDLPPVVPKDVTDNKKKAHSYRKKPKRLNNLEVNSDDEADDSDEDFKGSSSNESEEDDFEEDSDDSFVGKKKSRPVRRSTRARTTRYDADFINDDSDDGRKKKKKKIFFDDSESEESDDWRGKRKKQRKVSPHKKSKKKKKRFADSDLETYRKKKPKIKYGIDSDDNIKGRRTRGKKTSYLDTLGSDSEEEALKKKVRDKSEDDEYIAEDEEKESEEEFDAELDKDSEEDKEARKDAKTNSDSKNSDSEEDSLLVKKIKMKRKRAIIDSEDEEEEENATEISQDDTKEVKEKSLDNNVKELEFSNKSDDLNQLDEPEKSDQNVPKITDEVTPLDSQNIPVRKDELVIEESEKIRELEKEALEKPSSVVVPMLNVEKLKACGITLTKVTRDKLDSPLNTDDVKSSSNLMEIGVKPIISTLIQKNNQNLVPLTVERIERNLEGFNVGDEVKEMMGDEERPGKSLPLAATEIRSNLIKDEFGCTPSLDETKNFVKSPFSIMSNRKLGDNSLKKFRTGRFYSMRTPQEPMLGSSVSLGMSNDDNDELSEPPGVALPLFSDIGSSSIHSIPKSNMLSRIPRNCTPPPVSHNRTIPLSTHSPGGQQLSTPINVSVSSPYSSVINNPLGITGHIRPHHQLGTSPPLGPSSVSNINNSTNSPPISGPTAPNIPLAVNMPLVNRSKSATPPSSISPEGTPKKRRGRGKGKKTLAAEAAAAAVAAGLPLPEPTKASPNKPLAPNIEIASPPQPFSQSQPAPSVITRMLQSTPGKAAFPVGRIRPKQFAMMPDVDNENEGSSRSAEPVVDPSHKDVPLAHPPHSGHYGTPVSGQYPTNYYQKESHGPPQSYHNQRPVQPPIHSYSQHPTQSASDSSSLNPSVLNQSPMNPPPINQPLVNQTPMSQPPMSQPIINQSTLNPPSLSQAPINLSASTPPPMTQYPSASSAPKQPYDAITHRSTYNTTSSGYGYDYNSAAPPATVNTEEVLHNSYENTTTYPEHYDNSGSGLDPNMKNIEDEPSGEFGGLVSYFSSQHEDDLDT